MFSLKTSMKEYVLNHGKGLLLLSLILLLLVFELGNRPFATPDEARYVEIPREMVTTGDYLTPRLNGVKYFEKPPLFYWLQVGAIKLLGFKESSMRFWTVVLGFVGCLSLYHFTKSHEDETTALWATFILGLSPLYFSLSRLIILDMAVTICVTVALFCFYNGFLNKKLFHRRLWFYGFSIFSALGVLTKGIMTLAISGPVIILWLTFTKKWGQLRPLFFPSAFVLFLLITLPWHIAVGIKNPEFFYKYFIVEHFLRYTTDIHARTKPFWFFVPILFLGFLPWSFFIPKALINAWRERFPLSLFLILWAGWVFFFFSFSNSKLIPYILPAFPPLALILGRFIAQGLKSKEFFKPHLKVLTLFFLLLIPSFYGYSLNFTDILSEKEELIPYLHILCFIFISNGLLLSWFVIKKKEVLNRNVLLQKFLPFVSKTHSRLAILAFHSLITLIVLIKASPYLQKPSIKSLALMVQRHKTPGDEVVSFMSYYQDLPVYVKGIVAVVEAKGELEFGTQVEDTSTWMINKKEFLRRYKSKKRLWGVGRETEVEKFKILNPTFSPFIIAEEKGNVLFSNREF